MVLLEQTLDALVESRRREGARLAELIAQRVSGMREQVEIACTRMPVVIEAVREAAGRGLSGAMLDRLMLDDERVELTEREEVDDLTAWRYEQYFSAKERGFLDRVLVPLEVLNLQGKAMGRIDDDLGVRRISRDSLKGMRELDTCVTGGTQTHASDGMATLLVTTAERARELSPRPEIDIRLVARTEVRTSPSLMPESREDRAVVRSFCNSICCDIHPLNNLRVLAYLQQEFGVNDAQRDAWYGHWIHEGFRAAETVAERYGGPFVFGESVTLADACLIPQVYNARRFEVSLVAYPKIRAVEAHCNSLPEFTAAAPENQPDAP